jgi:V8-like Glu-specific endopeptidase
MRRTVGVIVGAVTAVALAGTAGAAAWTMTDDDRSPVVGQWRQPKAEPVSATSGSAGGAAVDRYDAPRGARGAAPAAGPQAARTEGATVRGAEGGTGTAGTVTVGVLRDLPRVLGYEGGTRRETISHPGADYIKVHFAKLVMLPGDHVTVSNPAGTESYRYEAPPVAAQVLRGAAPASGTGRWAMSISGDTAVVELHRASVVSRLAAPLAQLGVKVDRIARGHTAAERAAKRSAPAGPGREESVCGSNQALDAVCYRSADPVVYNRSKGIARLLINGTELCTGWRIGGKNRMLTNNHCFDNSADAYETEVWFNYQCATCGGYQVVRPTKVWGDRVLSTHRTYDYTVFTVENFAAVQKFGYLVLDLRRPARGEQLYVLQHPAGEPAMIAGTKGERAGNCSVVDNAYDGYARDTDVSYYCDTEGGSSGSPVLSRVSHRVVAIHHFGGCPNSGVRADLLWSKIKYVL